MNNNTKGRVLLTGGAGYIGAVLCEKLVNAGFDVRLFDRFYFGREPIAKLNSKIEVIEGDIRDFPEDLFNNIDTVIHLAALSNDPTAEFNPQANHQINTESAIRLAKLAKKKGVKKFIFASSCSIYDLGLENENGIKDEIAKVEPKAAYSSSKFQAEKKILKLADKDFCVVILRKGTVFGFSPRMRYDLVVNTMVKNTLSSGTIKVLSRGIQWRPLVDVNDVAEAYLKALGASKEKVNGQVFNISRGNFLMKDLAYIVQKALKKHFSINPKIIFKEPDRKDRSYRVSNQKARQVLNFIPKVSIEESVIKIVGQIKKNKFTDFENPIYYNIDWMRPILEKEIR